MNDNFPPLALNIDPIKGLRVAIHIVDNEALAVCLIDNPLTDIIWFDREGFPIFKGVD